MTSAELHEAEKQRRRARFEQGRSIAQKTTRSRDKARAAKRPGRRERQAWRKEWSL